MSPQSSPVRFPEVPGKWKNLRSIDFELLPGHPFPGFITQLSQLKRMVIQHPGEFPTDCVPVPQPNLKEIHLSNVKWEEWPASWSEFEGLQSLYLKRTNLHELPPSFANCQELTSLSILHSPFKELPRFLTSLKNLWTLSLIHTEISEIPEEIIELKNLKELSIHAGPLRKLPESLKEMTWLEDIYLEGLKLNKPDVLALMAALPGTRVHW